MQPNLTVNKKLGIANQNHLSKSNDIIRKSLPRTSIKRPAKSELKSKEMDRLKLDESAQSSSAVVNGAKVEPESSKRKQSAIIQDNQSMECSQAEEYSVASNPDESTEPRSKIPRIEQTEQALRSLVTDVDKRSEVINIDDEDNSQRVKKPDHDNNMNHANSASNTLDVSKKAAKPFTAAEQSTQPNQSTQRNHQEYIPDRSSLSNFQPQTENVRSLTNVDDHKLHVDEVSNRLCSQKMSAQLYNHMKKARRLIPNQIIERRIRPMEMERSLAITAQNPSNSINKTKKNLTGSVEQPAAGTQKQSQNDQQVLRTHTRNSRDKTAPLRYQTSKDLADVDPRNVPRNDNNAAASSQQLPSLSHKPPSYMRRSDGHQNSIANERTHTHFNQNQYLPTNQDNFQQKNTFQRVTKNTLSHYLTKILNSLQKSLSTNQARRSPQRCIIDENLSPYHAVTSDSDASTDYEGISDHEMSTDEAPAETKNNVYGTANDPGHGSADRPTAAQNSTARSHQMSRKFIFEQQMLDGLVILFNEMCSTFHHVTDMYNKFRSFTLDTAETYNKVLGSVEKVNEAINASPSRKLRTESLRPLEERLTKGNASSSNQDQYSNEVAKKKNLYRFVLPPEYDAYDERWTLKFRTNQPGLVELMSQSGVYVSNEDLEYCQKVSIDCKSLAQLLLLIVFNRNALSVCSSLSEKAQSSNSFGSNVRPDLDGHACSVLLNFVLEHGLLRGWNTDLKPILNTLHSKMQEIRFKYGVMVEC